MRIERDAVRYAAGHFHADHVPMTFRSGTKPSGRECGQVLVVFALLIPVVLALGGAVIGIGNWYVHGKNLQTKADAGAFGGGSAWSFPCVNGDTAIVDQARHYAGPTSTTPAGVNPQVGGVVSSSVHTVLNGPNWYDDDTNLAPSQSTIPAMERRRRSARPASST